MLAAAVSVIVAGNVLRCRAQQLPSIPEALSELRWCDPHQAASGGLHGWSNPGLRKSPLWRKRRQCHDNDDADDHTPEQTEGSSQQTIEPTETHSAYDPA